MVLAELEVRKKSGITKSVLEDLRNLIAKRIVDIDKKGDLVQRKKIVYYVQIDKAIINLISFCMLHDEYPEDIKPFKKKGMVGYRAYFKGRREREFY